MSNIPKSLESKISKYFSSLPEQEKKDTLNTLYHDYELSWGAIAEMAGTYTNKILREAKKLKIKFRDKSEAQKTALKSNRHKHPTKGTKHSEKTKTKISEGVHESWKNLTPEEKEERSRIAREQWKNMSEAQKANLMKKAHKAIIKASKEGSKLEKFLYDELTHLGHHVDFHEKHIISNETLELDLFLPEIKIAIEVDGISHIEDIWGPDTFKRNKKADKQKAGLLLNKKIKLIRIQYNQSVTEKLKRDVLEELQKHLENNKEDLYVVLRFIN